MTNMNTTKGERKQHHTPEFKAQMVRRILREEKSVSQLGAEYDINPNQLYRWRDIALQGLPSLFTHGKGQEQPSETAAHEQKVHSLYAEIGRLSTELAALKKKVGWLDELK